MVPGGDPGHAPPGVLMALLEKQTANLRRFHPHAQMWVSPQGYSDAWMEEFLELLAGGLDWLTGVVYGPWVYGPIDRFRERIPGRYPIRNYPDITHSLDCQLPVPDWDVAYAITEGREVINPRPLGEAALFRHQQPSTIGFLTYSEGCHDDVNKMVWSRLGWDPDADVVEILRDYSRYFIGERYTDDFAQGLLALERNWQGPLATNVGVTTTLQQFQALEAAASPFVLKNWRFQQALYRAYYDAYVRSRLLHEEALEEQANDVLRRAVDAGRDSLLALAEAEAILDRAVTRPISLAWRTRLFQLAEALFQSPAHMQLSVKLYQGQEEVRGATLDGCDFPLNNRPWLKARFAELRQLPDETERLAGIRAILDWTESRAGRLLRRPEPAVGAVAPGDRPGVRRRSRLHGRAAAPLPVSQAWRRAAPIMADIHRLLAFQHLRYALHRPRSRGALPAARGLFLPEAAHPDAPDRGRRDRDSPVPGAQRSARAGRVRHPGRGNPGRRTDADVGDRARPRRQSRRRGRVRGVADQATVIFCTERPDLLTD